MSTLYNVKPFVVGMLAVVAGTSCYREIDLEKYRNKEGENLLTLNSLVCPDSAVAVAATRTYFFADKHNSREYVKELDIELTVNGEYKETLEYDDGRHMYFSTYMPVSGDRINVSTVWNGETVSASDIVPRSCNIEKTEVARRGPVTIYSDNDYVITYRITFSDTPGEKNYYFLQWDEMPGEVLAVMGERDFSHELVFRRLAAQLSDRLPGWTPYSLYGLPFSDDGIDGTTHTLVVEEIMQDTRIDWEADEVWRDIRLYTISEDYYRYLVSALVSRTNDNIFQGGMIDLGLADPVKVYSNISDGTGILGCYTLDRKTVDVNSHSVSSPGN